MFRLRCATAAPISPVAAAGRGPAATTPELQAELREAWAELAEAAKASKVKNFHACTRTARHWTEDPAAVRAIAATLREFPDTDSQQTT